MKKMKKILALLLALAMVFTLVACGSKDGGQADADNDQQDGDTPATTTITFATYPVGQMATESVVSEMIAAFNEEHPEITVKVQYLDYTNGDDTVNTAIEAGTAPDVIFEGPERLIANWGAKGYLVDLADLVPAGTYDATVAYCTSSNGAVYELPVCQTSHVMGINRDLFEEAGAWQYIDEETHTWTTENFVKAVQAVYDYTGKTVGVVFCGGQGGDQGNRALIRNLYGGRFANEEHTEYLANSPEMVKALELLVSMDGIEFDPAIAGGDELMLFCNGTLAMATCWNAAQEKSETAGQTAQFDIFPMAFPCQEGTDPVLDGGIWGFGVFDNGDEAKIEAAKTFIKFMTEDDAQYTKTVEATQYWPTREIEGMYADDEIMQEYGLLVPYMGDYYQVTLGWTEARTAWWNELQNIGNGSKDVQTAMDDFVATANAAAAAAQ